MNDVLITKTMLANWLERLEGHNIWALFDHGDHQDVPRATTLLCLISDLRDLDEDDLDPSEYHTYRALELLGEMFAGLVEPFILLHLSLSEQIIRLVKFAYIAFALFRKHETSFMPNQLYGDLQCMFKNAIFIVAQTKELNLAFKVFLCLLGDDVLEVLFGRARMIGGHDPNVDVEQLRERFASALRCDEIFSRYPSLEMRPRRLNLERTSSSDHYSPRHWKGELTAGSCDLESCFKKGAEEASACLERAGYSINLEATLDESGVDLMCPNGNRYPGLPKEADRSIVDAASQLDATTIASDLDPEIILSDAAKILSFDGEAALAAEKDSVVPNESGTPHSIWMKLDDSNSKGVHKKTILRQKMNPNFDLDHHKSHDRLLRVRTFSARGDGWDHSVSNIEIKSNKDTFTVGGLFASLVAVNNGDVSLAILQCTTIRTSSVHHPALCLPSQSAKYRYQIPAMSSRDRSFRYSQVSTTINSFGTGRNRVRVGKEAAY